MRRDLVLVLVIAAAAFGIRTYPAWSSVFAPGGVTFLENDAWYHVRLAEHQVRNYPWRLTLDPYAAPGGQFVPVAPLFDTLVSTVAVVFHGRDAETAQVERIAAMLPPLLGVLTIVAVWALGRQLFDRRAGLLAAALLAVLPGHFLDRTMLGFVDHHALEALLAITTLLALTRTLERPSMKTAALAGVSLGLYLLAWGSGAFLVAIIGGWLLLLAPLGRGGPIVTGAAEASGVAAVVALMLVLTFQDSAMHRYGSQILALLGLAGMALAARLAAARQLALPRGTIVASAVVAVVLVATAAVWLLAPALMRQLVIDIGRLAPDATRMAVLEARPLFLYSGEWNWVQPWLFFRTGFFIGLIALVPFTMRVWTGRRAGDLLLWTFAVVMLIATVGQNRFGYYLVAAFALLGGWLATRILDWGRVPHAGDPAPAPRATPPYAREIAIVAVVAMFAPNLSPAVLLAERQANFQDYWRSTMGWFRDHTPPPFVQAAGAGDEYYFAPYADDAVPAPDYSVMNWWDQGYLIMQSARRVPATNPTQARAPVAARFYTETDASRALERLQAERSRYVLADWELPFRKLPNGVIMGRFQSVLDWAGVSHGRFYEIMYRRDGSEWAPVWVFFEPYYQTMAFRLMVLGGAPAEPIPNATSVITVVSRQDITGLRFREIVSAQAYPTYAAARQAASANAGADTFVVGLDPWRPAFPLSAVAGLTEVHAARLPGQPHTQPPWVRVFEVQADARAVSASPATQP